MWFHLNKYLQSLPGHTSQNLEGEESSTDDIKQISGSPGVDNSAGQMDYIDCLFFVFF